MQRYMPHAQFSATLNAKVVKVTDDFNDLNNFDDFNVLNDFNDFKARYKATGSMFYNPVDVMVRIEL